MKMREILKKAMDKAVKSMEEQNARNADRSQLCQGSIEHMIRKIDVVQHELKLLLALTESVGGFGSTYPRRCDEELSLFKTILEMELKNDR